MLGKRIINTGGVSCTTDTTQILDAGATQSAALYRFEDNANDTSNSTGKFGKGAGLTGATSIELPGQILNDLHNANTHSISVSTWIYWQGQTSESYAHLISAGYNQSGKAFWVGIGYSSSVGTSGVSNELYVSGPSVSANWTGVSMPINQWSHVVLTWTGTSSKLYLNKTLIATTTMPTLDWRSSGNGFRLGRYYYNSNYYTKGFYDQTRIFNKAITQTEVNTLYAETTSTVDTIQILGDTSLKALYKFDGNLNDSSGNNYAPTANSSIYYDYNGTASGVTYVTGKFSKAASFDGSNDYIDLGDIIATSTRAISIWVNSDDFSERWPFQQGDGQGTENYIRFYNTDDIQVRWGNVTQTFSGYSANTWYHIVAQKDENNNANVWINGVEMGSSGSPSSITVNQTQIGRRYNNSAYQYYFKGKIDQVRIFDKALSSGEINSLYNETATSAASGTIENPSTIAYYKMADGSDETGSYDATTINNVNFNVEGKYGFAGKFNGTNSYMTTGLTWPGGTQLSWSGWIKTSNTKDTYVFGDYASGGANASHRFSVRIYSQILGASINDAGGGLGTTITFGTFAHYGEWAHLVITVDGTTVKAYVNGSQLGSTGTSSKSLAAGANPFVLGNYGPDTGVSQQFDGTIDQVRIFNKAISASEVTTLYNEIQCANTITTPESYFNTKLYTGNGGTQSITGVGFKPDLTWVKNRDVTGNHSLIDSVRGVSKPINSNTNGGEQNYSGYALTSFLNDGFSVTDTSTGIYGWNGPAGSTYGGSTGSYVSWNWKGASSSVTNNVGTITSTVSASPESGFSIVKYTATGTIITNTVGHGLTTKPSLIIQKAVASGANWFPITDVIDGSVDYFYLNSDAAKGDMTGIYANFSINDTTFTNWYSNTSGDVITYCFANVDGYQRIGSYIGTGSAGPFVYTGFEPAWLMIKEASNTGNWCIYDNKRDTVNPNNKVIAANSSNTESSYSSGYNVNFYTNGFEIAENTSNDLNTSGSTYMFMAIAANPDTTAPTKANSFKTVLYNGTGSSQSITGTGFKPDLTWIKNRANGVTNSWHTITDSVRGGGTRVWPNATNAEAADNYDVLSFQNDGFTIGTGTYSSYNGGSFVSWNWKGLDHDRNLATINNDGSITSLVSANPAAGFSVVKWIGTGVNGTKIGHGLQGSPEMIITKGLSNATSWVIGVGNISGLSINDYFTFTGYAKANSSTFYQAYSTDTFQVGVSAANEMNKSSSNQYISYCFRTITGHSKVGKYTGTGVSGLEIALDFSPSFLLVKGAGATGWIIIDNQRPTPGGNYELYPHLSNTEDTSATSFLLGTNKFTVNSTGTWHNINGTDYIYLAIK